MQRSFWVKSCLLLFPAIGIIVVALFCFRSLDPIHQSVMAPRILWTLFWGPLLLMMLCGIGNRVIYGYINKNSIAQESSDIKSNKTARLVRIASKLDLVGGVFGGIAFVYGLVFAPVTGVWPI